MTKTTEIRESAEAKVVGQRRRAKLISADVWGATAFYPAAVLERDAATAFPSGTKMLENHLTDSESWENPNGKVQNLVGKLTSAGQFEPDHPEGPGVYADVEFYASYTPRINEIGDDIGLSVHGSADYVEGERDGRFGKIVTGIPYIKSVDVVVDAGAGGKLVEIIESARFIDRRPITDTEGDQSMTALTKEDLDAFAKTLSTTIKESLSALQVAVPNEPVAPVVEVTAPAAAEVTAPVVEAAPAVEAEDKPETEPVVVDHVTLAVKISEAELPAAVIPGVVAAVQAGATVEDAIKAQTEIKEAFRAQERAGTVRLVESDRGQSDEGADLRAAILKNFK